MVPALAVAAASPVSAAPKVPCWKLVLNDAYAGVFDQIYPLSCYHQAIAHIPATTILYSDTADEIRDAEAAALHGRTFATRHPQSAPAVAAVSSGGSSLPTPVLVLGGLAVALLLAGGAGELWRRTRRS
ncbi:MAG TPA: hypothetical protein VH063_10530 [Gaiellaceae bacterium]|nr:hypothetical protein [Gaiellaceae bacterium]